MALERKRELQARSTRHEQEAHKNYKQDRASTSTTNLPWALKRANDMWKAIEEDREEMTAKKDEGKQDRQGLTRSMDDKGLDKEHGRPRRQGAWTTKA